MSFSIFTARSREISTRLRLVGRGFQLSAIAVWTMTAVWMIATPFLPLLKQPIHLYRWMFAPVWLYYVLAGASMYLIGRALLRRQRWGAYLAAFTLGVPLLKQLFSPDMPILSISGIVVSTLALCAIVTVWDELGTVRDADFVDPDGDEDNELPRRNRGFGEPRSLPLQSMSQWPTLNAIVEDGRDPMMIEHGPVLLISTCPDTAPTPSG